MFFEQKKSMTTLILDNQKDLSSQSGTPDLQPPNVP